VVLRGAAVRGAAVCRTGSLDAAGGGGGGAGAAAGGGADSRGAAGAGALWPPPDRSASGGTRCCPKAATGISEIARTTAGKARIPLQKATVLPHTFGNFLKETDKPECLSPTEASQAEILGGHPLWPAAVQVSLSGSSHILPE
jgi:hypothetical protein